MNLRVVVHAAEEGGYWAEVPALPGCVSEGETMDELLADVREAVEAWLEAGASGLPYRFTAMSRSRAVS